MSKFNALIINFANKRSVFLSRWMITLIWVVAIRTVAFTCLMSAVMAHYFIANCNGRYTTILDTLLYCIRGLRERADRGPSLTQTPIPVKSLTNQERDRKRERELQFGLGVVEKGGFRVRDGRIF